MIDITPLLERLRVAQTSRSSKVSAEAAASIEQALRELDDTWEELSAATEELRIQNEQLAAAQQELERVRQRYRNLFEYGPDACLVTNVHGVVQDANASATRLLQTRTSYLVNKPILFFVDLAHRATVRQVLARITQLEALRDWEVVLRRRQSGPLSLSATVVRMPAAPPEPPELLWVLRDLSETRRVIAELHDLRTELISRRNTLDG